jgi:hypothetical protein
MGICGQSTAQIINLGCEPVNNQAEGIHRDTLFLLDLT